MVYPRRFFYRFDIKNKLAIIELSKRNIVVTGTCPFS